MEMAHSRHTPPEPCCCPAEDHSCISLTCIVIYVCFPNETINNLRAWIIVNNSASSLVNNTLVNIYRKGIIIWLEDNVKIEKKSSISVNWKGLNTGRIGQKLV